MEVGLITLLIVGWIVVLGILYTIYKQKQEVKTVYVPMLDNTLGEEMYYLKQKYKALVVEKEKLHQNLEKQVKINIDLNNQLDDIVRIQNSYRGIK